MFWPFQTSAPPDSPRLPRSSVPVIRTSDGVFAPLHEKLLLGSSVFRDMVDQSAPFNESQIITILENYSTFAVLRHFATHQRRFSDFYNEDTKGICIVAEAAIKYDLSCAIQGLAQILTSPRFLEKNSFRAYCIACHYGWEWVARKAARHSFHFGPLITPGVTHPEDLALISGVSYHNLLVYHEACRAATREISDQDLSSCTRYGVWNFPRCSKCGGRRIYQGHTILLPVWLTALLIDVSLEIEGIPPDAPVSKAQHVKNALKAAAKCNACSKKVDGGTVDGVVDAYVSQLRQKLSEVTLAFK